MNPRPPLQAPSGRQKPPFMSPRPKRPSVPKALNAVTKTPLAPTNRRYRHRPRHGLALYHHRIMANQTTANRPQVTAHRDIRKLTPRRATQLCLTPKIEPVEDTSATPTILIIAARSRNPPRESASLNSMSEVCSPDEHHTLSARSASLSPSANNV